MNDIWEKIKEGLYTKVKSPFLVSYICVWIVWNWKFVYYSIFAEKSGNVILTAKNLLNPDPRAHFIYIPLIAILITLLSPALSYSIKFYIRFLNEKYKDQLDKKGIDLLLSQEEIEKVKTENKERNDSLLDDLNKEKIATKNLKEDFVNLERKHENLKEQSANYRKKERRTKQDLDNLTNLHDQLTKEYKDLVIHRDELIKQKQNGDDLINNESLHGILVPLRLFKNPLINEELLMIHDQMEREISRPHVYQFDTDGNLHLIPSDSGIQRKILIEEFNQFHNTVCDLKEEKKIAVKKLLIDHEVISPNSLIYDVRKFLDGHDLILLNKFELTEDEHSIYTSLNSNGIKFAQYLLDLNKALIDVDTV